MKQGTPYSGKEKTIILNVFKYFRQEFPDKCITEIVRMTSNATGCSGKSVFQFRKEEASGKGFKEPLKNKIRKCININSRDIKYDNSVRQTIRTVIYDLQYKNIVPSLNTILKQLRMRNDIPTFSLMTLRRLMLDMGFYYQKNGSKSILVENPDMRLLNVEEKPGVLCMLLNQNSNNNNPVKNEKSQAQNSNEQFNNNSYQPPVTYPPSNSLWMHGIMNV